MSYTHQEVDYLRSHRPEISDVTAELALTRSSLVADTEVLRRHFGEYARAVTELVTARRSTIGKLPSDWLMCSESAQQSTPPTVAAVRARRIADHLGAGARVHDVTCSIGSELPQLTAVGLAVTGSDLDPVRVRMARVNTGSAVAVADALVPPLSPGAVDAVVADPARRAGGRRITRPDQLLPPLPELIAAHAGTPAAVKCAPGLDFSGWDGLVSVASVDGGVKEACLYSPQLGGGERREAVMISTKVGTGPRLDRITDLSGDGGGESLAGPPGRYIVDPDGAVVRSGLVRHYALREKLWMLDDRIAHLTGDRIPEGRTGFPFIEQVPLKKLKTVLRKHGCGALEILVRGVDIDPDKLRRNLKLAGDRPMSVVVTRIGSAGVALVCGPRADGVDRS
ncbi:SAM-dependent methyltransferase [Corynebacterium sp. CCM 9185]|uniref:SAM-dependent methyltransferase n=1 Tax=Corynebacterium marambiense TaxID=2765364 RepID=A0ABS0VV34_9CORY|nr:SAM-dependent methyltransferase [Corynebacterium marambiense]MBI9000216.1 SAM-dependent methyltransferase [Corynebacterium marambiense]MCK7663570.1 SAM-dependent methyltransferase [Corynebacterium marambiense]MCX7541996.1 SAM-dependent methyltransferase [Corynebacterium marambiense]